MLNPGDTGLERWGVFSFGVVGLEALFHDLECGFAFVDQDEVAVVFCGGFAGGAASGEEVEDGLAGVGVDADDALEDA